MDPAAALGPAERARVERAAMRALRALLLRVRSRLLEIEARPAPWPAKWTAFKLSARQVIEEQETVRTPLAVLTAETARAILGEALRLEDVEPSLERRWTALRRWIETREALRFPV